MTAKTLENFTEQKGVRNVAGQNPCSPNPSG